MVRSVPNTNSSHATSQPLVTIPQSTPLFPQPSLTQNLQHGHYFLDSSHSATTAFQHHVPHIISSHQPTQQHLHMSSFSTAPSFNPLVQQQQQSQPLNSSSSLDIPMEIFQHLSNVQKNQSDSHYYVKPCQNGGYLVTQVVTNKTPDY